MKVKSGLVKILVDIFTTIAFFLFVIQMILLYGYISSFLSRNPDFPPGVILYPSMLVSVLGLFFSVLSVLDSTGVSSRWQKKFSEVFSRNWWDVENFQSISGVVLVTEGLTAGICLPFGYRLSLVIPVVTLMVASTFVKFFLLKQIFRFLTVFAYSLISFGLSFGVTASFL